jgi:hypothetical protein
MTAMKTNKTSYVPAQPESSRVYPMTTHQAQVLERWGSEPTHGITIEPAFVPHGHVEEHTTSTDRSVALIIRLIPFTLIWLVLSLAVVWLLAVDNAVGYLLFAVLTAFTYYMMDRSEREFSTTGLERHRIDVAASLAREKMRTDAHLRREVVRAHLNLLARQNEDHQR